MKITGRTRSTEPCQEAGWVPFTYCTDNPIDETFVMSLRHRLDLLRPGCSFLFMRRLARPFFKIQSDDCLVRGIIGDRQFVVAVDGDDADKADMLVGVSEEGRSRQN